MGQIHMLSLREGTIYFTDKIFTIMSETRRKRENKYHYKDDNGNPLCESTGVFKLNLTRTKAKVTCRICEIRIGKLEKAEKEARKAARKAEREAAKAVVS